MSLPPTKGVHIMRKKTTLLLILLLLRNHSVNAYLISIGSQIGHHTYEPERSKYPGMFTHQLDNHIGAFLRLNLLLFYLHPSVKLTHSIGKTVHGELQFRSVRCNVPITLETSLLGVRAYAGPMLSIPVLIAENNIYSNSFPSLRYQAGLGIDMFGLLIDLQWEGKVEEYKLKIGACIGYQYWKL